jgi:hypothetical protein
MMSGTLFALWLVLSAGLLLLFFYAAYLNWRNRNVRDLELGELIPSFLPVDETVLAELANLEQEQRLFGEAGKEQKRHLESQRAQLAGECLRRMSHNAALLQRLGYSQLHSPNQLVSAMAQEMIDAGVNVRLYSFLGLAGLRLQSWFHLSSVPLPPVRNLCDIDGLFAASIIPAYQVLKDKAGDLTCLKFSSLHQELLQSL